MNIAELVSILINIIAPVILVAALGFTLARAFSLDSRTLSRLSLYLFSPTLTFTSIYKSQLGIEFVSILAFALIISALIAVVSFVLVRAMRFDRLTSSAFMLSTVFVNAGNFGLPLNLFAFGEEGLNRAVVFFVATSVLTQTVAVFIAARGNAANRAALLQVFRMPLVYAAAVAVVLNVSHWQIPEPMMKSVDLISGGTVPLVLVILGAELSRVTLSQDRFAIGLATFVRLAVAPILAFGVAAVMGMQGVTRSVCILEASTPTAVLVSILAGEFRVRPEFVTSVIFISTLVSIVSMTILIGVLR